MAKTTYKDLYRLVDDAIVSRIDFNTTTPLPGQLSRQSVAPAEGNAVSDLSTAKVVSAIQDLLLDALPQFILSGLDVSATSPTSASVNVTAGKVSKGGAVYELLEDTTIPVPFDNTTTVFFINFYANTVKVEASESKTKATLAKIIVPAPGVTVDVIDTKDGTFSAYIISYKTFDLHGNKFGQFEEDTIELLRDNIGTILADNIIGNIRLNENLKITNTQGTLELDSDSLSILNTSGGTLAKFNKDGTFFYDNNGVEVARFTTSDAKIGNIIITTSDIHSGNYISETSGFTIQDSGFAEFGDVRIRGRISSSVFESDKISAVGGKLYIQNASVLTVNMTALDSCNLILEDSFFAVGDVLRIKDGINEEWMLVTDITNAPTYVVTRDLAASYPTDTNPTWQKGTTIVSTGNGNSGSNTNGFMILDGVSQYSPFIDIAHRNSTTYNDYTVNARLGNLAGITDSLYGTLSGYGLYSSNVYLRGKLYAPDIKTAITGARVELSSTGLFAYDVSGNVVFGALLNNIGGLADANDVIIGNVSSGNYILWDNDLGVLSVRGDIVVSGGKSSFVSTVVFTSTTNDNKVTWTSGNIAFSDGTSGAINSGNATISSKTYIYYDSAIGATLQTSTLYTDSMGTTKTLLGIAEAPDSGHANPSFNASPLSGTRISGTSIVTGFVSADRIQANTITASKLVVGTITANEIAASTITGDRIAAATITADRLSVTQLSAVATNTGTLTVDQFINVGANVQVDGSGQSFKVFSDLVTIVTGTNDKLDWTENGVTKVCTLSAADYSLSGASGYTSFCSHVQTQMRGAGDANTTVTYDSTTRKITLANSTLSTFTFLFQSGTNATTNCGRTLGFDITADKTGALTYTGSIQAGLRVELGLLQ